MSPQSTPRVFLITGSNRGLGHALVQHVLNTGEHVIATSRHPPSTLTPLFQNTDPQNFLPLYLDVTSEASITSAFTTAIHHFPRIDVVINNAAHGLIGALETLSTAQILAQFNTNFFGVVSITRHAIHAMRTHNSPPGGTIIQVSSLATLGAFPMVSAMVASKRAVDALTECVQQELRPEWGIRCAVVKLDHFKSEAHGKSMVYGEEVGEEVKEAYAHMDGRAWVRSLENAPAVGIEKAAEALCGLAGLEDLPVQAVIGKGAMGMARKRWEGQIGMLEREDLRRLAEIGSL